MRDGAAPDFATGPWALRCPTRDARYLFHCRAFALAAAARLTLPDALQTEWLPTSLAFWLGAGLLAYNGAPLGWALSAAGSLLPVLLLQDQLSQSVYLGMVALTASWCSMGTAAARARRLTEALPSAVRTLTVLLYAFAVFHKLNRDYLNPAVGCANEGLRVLFEQARFEAPAALLALFDSALWPVAHLLAEAAIPVLLVRWPSVGIKCAAVLHVPLTLIFAPSFVFTMMSGWVCFLSSASLQRFVRTVRARAAAIVVTGAVLAGSSRWMWFVGRWSEDPEWCVKEFVFWLACAALWLALPSARSAGRPSEPALLCEFRVLLPAGVFVLNALSPYFGWQFHHTAAMLSNLRIDRGCWNSLLVPEALRGTDPYVRLSRVEFAAHRATPEAARAFEDRLWEPARLFEARARWCRTHVEPLPVSGDYQGRTFAVPDFCAADGWPLEPPPWPGFRRFQVNVTRECARRCLH